MRCHPARPGGVPGPEARRSRGERPRLRRLPHADRQLPAVPGQRRGEVPAAAVAAALQSEGRRSAVPAGRRRRLPDPRRRRARLQQPAPERTGARHVSAAAEHPADRSGDQRAVRRHVRRRVAQRADRQRRGADRPRRDQPVAPRPERVGRLSAGRRASGPCRSRRSRRFTAHAQVGNAPPQRMLDDLASFQRILFTNHRVRALSDAVREGTLPLPDADRTADRARAGRQGRVRPRLHAVPWRPRPVDAAGAGGALPRHLDPVSAARRRRDARRASRSRRARRSSRATPGPTRSRCPTARTMRRTSSDPGRALLTGFVGGAPAPQDDWNKLDVPGLRGLRRTAPVLPQQQRGDDRGGGRSLHRVLQAGHANARAGREAAHPQHRRRRTSIGRRRRRSACR